MRICESEMEQYQAKKFQKWQTEGSLKDPWLRQIADRSFMGTTEQLSAQDSQGNVNTSVVPSQN